jgi:two-component system response regulator HydG
MAHGGTILIDGVSELAPGLQAKLLRIVQERSFERLAGTRTLEVDVRILSSTQVDVEPFVESGQFRKDLYYRLNVIHLDLPPLREHLEDLPDLADECLRAIATQRGEKPRRLSPGALDRLMDHDWPGNLRELHNVIESSVILDDRSEIPAAAIRINSPEGSGPIALATRSRYSLAQLEEMYIRATLRVTRGNRTEAARILGINRKTLLEKRKRYGIP